MKKFKLRVEVPDNKPSENLLEMMEDYISDLFEARKKHSEWRVMAYRGCTYRPGGVELMSFCGKEDCHSCNYYAGLLHEAVKDFATKAEEE